MNYVVYKLVSPKKETYIGLSKDIEDRFHRYKTLDCKNQPKLYRAIKKHGFKKFKVEILMENLPTKQHAYMWERLFIFLEKAFEKGLNLTQGGCGRSRIAPKDCT